MDVKETIKKYKLAGAGVLGVALFWLYGLTEESPMPESSGTAEIEEVQVKEEEPAEEASQPVQVTVDIKGAVSMPGIYTMLSEERVNDVINKAGGITEQADAASVNLAQKVQDEMVIYIPVKGEEIPAVQTAPVSSGNADFAEDKEMVNINTADSAGLQELPGIGESKAQAIIDFRETDGPFTKVEDLKNVSGIGDKTFEKLAPLITVQ
ncbi:helix-hairpin-helix domain-containing protein [Domibacillus indicus]|uniref:helix-hairpin-helix domain-containing protein n=1 Tax=Domibacillus indicus TaxID=1437523 RepID=UPI000617EA29|nr:helix-hairpin-helix domain-containing protein [Domibacillus indicus]